MIKLRFTHRKFGEFPPPGTVLHLKVVSFDKERGGSYDLAVEDVTPLPYADVLYTCHNCGAGDLAQPDGSLPEGWIERKFEKAAYPYCDNDICQNVRSCRVCGCNDENGCIDTPDPCHWVEEDLCSACATPKK